jgi:hypothetical protein
VRQQHHLCLLVHQRATVVEQYTYTNKLVVQLLLLLVVLGSTTREFSWFFCAESVVVVVVVVVVARTMFGPPSTSECRLAPLPGERDITKETIVTTASSSTTHMLANMLDRNPSTFWESAGNKPHAINLQFKGRVAVSRIELYSAIGEDSSYVPQVVTLYGDKGIASAALVVDRAFESGLQASSGSPRAIIVPKGSYHTLTLTLEPTGINTRVRLLAVYTKELDMAKPATLYSISQSTIVRHLLRHDSELSSSATTRECLVRTCIKSPNEPDSIAEVWISDNDVS